MNEERNRQKLHEILDIVLDGNGFNARKRSETGTLPTIFMDFSGHVASMQVYMYSDGWHDGGSRDEDFEFYFDVDIKDEKIDALRTAVQKALTDKTASEVLERDIIAAERELKSKRNAIAKMKRNLRKQKMKEAKK